MKIPLTSKPCSTTANKTGGWRTYKPSVDLNKCISCGTCERVCPEGCSKLMPNKSFDKPKPLINFDYCKGCGICAEECPVKAIEMRLDI
jgi:pyruvate ferredoxin oxidoreductase delta subunit